MVGEGTRSRRIGSQCSRLVDRMSGWERSGCRAAGWRTGSSCALPGRRHGRQQQDRKELGPTARFLTIRQGLGPLAGANLACGPGLVCPTTGPVGPRVSLQSVLRRPRRLESRMREWGHDEIVFRRPPSHRCRKTDEVVWAMQWPEEWSGHVHRARVSYWAAVLR
jgi:hypothetical protein